MFLLQESIEKYGILNSLIVRPVLDGYYEIISGHRRKHAAEKLGYRKVPVIIRVLSEDDSILSMVDSNLHRERISYSEKAFAYKLKNDVLKRKSGRKKSQVDHKTPRKRSIDIISEDCGDSPKQVQRYISLTKLIPEMLQKLDDEIISFCPAVEIAALKENEQRELLKAMDYAKEHFYIREFEMNAQTPQVLVEDGIPASGKIKDPCLVKTAVQSRGGQTKEHKIRLLVSDEDEVKLVCHMKTKTEAPLEADTVMGNVTLFLNNEKIKENEIVTADGAERISLSWCAGQIIKKFFISG